MPLRSVVKTPIKVSAPGPLIRKPPVFKLKLSDVSTSDDSHKGAIGMGELKTMV